jgi:His-Xaa-Ser repeat protein HxsA
MSELFLIPTLLAAGFGKTGSFESGFTRLTTSAEGSSGTLFETFKQQHEVTLAEHRSHSSHSSHSSHQSGSSGGGHYSHSSHTSHQSSTGGYGPTPAPAPLYTPPPAPPRPASSSPYYSPAPNSGGQAQSPGRTPDKLTSLGGRTKRFAKIVRRVQIALLAQGDYSGPINGKVGPQTRAALRKFQSDHGLDSTGTITPQTLDALKVPSE